MQDLSLEHTMTTTSWSVRNGRQHGSACLSQSFALSAASGSSRRPPLQSLKGAVLPLLALSCEQIFSPDLQEGKKRKARRKPGALTSEPPPCPGQSEQDQAKLQLYGDRVTPRPAVNKHQQAPGDHMHKRNFWSRLGAEENIRLRVPRLVPGPSKQHYLRLEASPSWATTTQVPLSGSQVSSQGAR